MLSPGLLESPALSDSYSVLFLDYCNSLPISIPASTHPSPWLSFHIAARVVLVKYIPNDSASLLKSSSILSLLEWPPRHLALWDLAPGHSLVLPLALCTLTHDAWTAFAWNVPVQVTFSSYAPVCNWTSSMTQSNVDHSPSPGFPVLLSSYSAWFPPLHVFTCYQILLFLYLFIICLSSLECKLPKDNKFYLYC